MASRLKCNAKLYPSPSNIAEGQDPVDAGRSSRMLSVWRKVRTMNCKLKWQLSADLKWEMLRFRGRK